LSLLNHLLRKKRRREKESYVKGASRKTPAEKHQEGATKKAAAKRIYRKATAGKPPRRNRQARSS